LLRWTGGSAAYFYCAAVINVFAALLWLGMREREVIQRKQATFPRRRS
jgi:hypothetical protein